MTTDTPARLLTLLSLLQTPREWPGGELADRLGVSRRTIRRDIDRLRELGYPVQATLGAEGGYRLVAGKAMPPLVLDDEEAVAIAVGLRAGAGHALEGVDEASVRALAKLEQVLPGRLRHRVSTLQAATTPLTSGDGATIAPETLTVMASTVAGRERLRFAYRAADGTGSRRVVEPYRLVSTGRRWYLVAYDLDRADWRTFRVDRVSEPFATGARFTPRELPTGSAAEYLRRSMNRTQESYEMVVTFAAPAATVAARVPAWLGTPEPLDEATCRLRATVGDAKDWMAVRLAMLGHDFTVHEPPELVDAVRELGARMTRAASDDGGHRPDPSVPSTPS
ncbi:helix-turn-helix transcriptional regulator [Streptomyces pilosus]|uniref:DeoR family transcriptional regulator n=1 Tax=Streptomyces pilosus TaxID=28893 RepID=A0A918F1S6_9ACTN|nr:WYL domain-containing protein [Streptomyces pilosus]GGR00120.1 DeoR family transcriptional regulator [Streptomyces pilosus]GGV62970.1 DeoR family transcriptional regulator [Streptomyces pilosus]